MKPLAHGSARPGFLLVEALIGIAVFVLFAGAVGGTLFYGQENTIMAGERIRGTSASMRALEAARAIRDGAFSSLAAGTYGVQIGATGMWEFVASPQTVTGSYTTTVTVTASGSTWRNVSARTTWKRGYARSGAVLISTDIIDWRTATSLGDWRSPTVEGTFAPGGSPLFTRAAVGDSMLYVGSADATGLYVLNIANTASPVRIASSFSIGTTVYDVAVRGDRLYVITDDSNAELKVYDIADPNAPTAVTTVNLQGSGRGRSVAITDQFLLVGATQSGVGAENELYSYDISGTGALTLVDSENHTGDILSLATSGTGVYAASTEDATELAAFTIASSGSLAVSSAPGYSLSLDAASIAVTGTSAIIGTLKGATQEMVLFNVRSNVPALSSPGPWYHEGSGSVLGVAMDPSRCYGFLGVDSGYKAFQVVNVRDTSTLAELAIYNSTYGKGRGVTYDPVRDRAYLLTDQAVLLFRPAASTGSCP